MNKLILSLILTSFASTAQADFATLECKNPKPVFGFHLTATVFLKEYKKGSYEYCSGKEGSANVSIMMTGNPSNGVDTTFLETAGVFSGNLQRQELESSLAFHFSPIVDDGETVVPELKITGTNDSSIQGTLTLYQNVIGPTGVQLKKYMDIPVVCTSDAGILHQCDIWPRH